MLLSGKNVNLLGNAMNLERYYLNFILLVLRTEDIGKQIKPLQVQHASKNIFSISKQFLYASFNSNTTITYIVFWIQGYILCKILWLGDGRWGKDEKMKVQGEKMKKEEGKKWKTL